jgi:DNA excision repair protein ERCC-4
VRKTLKPEDITAVIDTREQTPWPLTPLRTQRGSLTTGDYSVLGLSDQIAIERKSLSDLLGCIGNDRERFERELKRLLAYPCRAIIVETTWQVFYSGVWPVRSRLKPASAIGSVLGWVAMGIPILFPGGASEASQCAARILFIAARRRFNELGAFYDGLNIAG